METFLKGKLTYLTGFAAILGGAANILMVLSGKDTGISIHDSVAAIMGGLATVGLRRAVATK